MKDRKEVRPYEDIPKKGSKVWSTDFRVDVDRG